MWHSRLGPNVCCALPLTHVFRVGFLPTDTQLNPNLHHFLRTLNLLMVKFWSTSTLHQPKRRAPIPSRDRGVSPAGSSAEQWGGGGSAQQGGQTSSGGQTSRRVSPAGGSDEQEGQPSRRVSLAGGSAQQGGQTSRRVSLAGGSAQQGGSA